MKKHFYYRPLGDFCHCCKRTVLSLEWQTRSKCARTVPDDTNYFAMSLQMLRLVEQKNILPLHDSERYLGNFSEECADARPTISGKWVQRQWW